jgi:hypothetical protein
VNSDDGREVSPLESTRGVREVSAADDGDGSRKAYVGLMLPVVLGPAPVEGIRARLVIPSVGKVPLGAMLGM